MVALVIRVLGLALFAAAGSVPAVSATLPDPTRPPANLGSNVVLPATSGPVLQSVLIAAHRRVAVIGGQTVQVGEKVGESKVVRIAEGEVELRSTSGTQVLKLFPGIEKRTTPTGDPARGGRR